MADAMPEFDITKKSRPVVITSYQPHWVDEFMQIARHIRDLVGRAAIRIDHIGSTAVPGLGAKDVIDIQITVSDLDEAGGLTSLLRAAGFRAGRDVRIRRLSQEARDRFGVAQALHA